MKKLSEMWIPIERGTVFTTTTRCWCYCLALMLVALWHPPFAAAVERVDLYSVEVPVESRSANERSRSAQRALAEVFVRASGTAEVVSLYPQLRGYLGSANRYLSSFQYALRSLPDRQADGVVVPETAGLTSGPGEKEAASELEMPLETGVESGEVAAQSQQLMLQLVFEERRVRDMLTAAGAPYWQDNRPVVLLWLVEQNAGEIRFLSIENQPEAVLAVEETATKRGLPVVAPLLDLEETMRISAEDIWEFNRDIILQASQRYAADIILVGKVSSTYRGYLGQWSELKQAGGDAQRYETGSMRQFIELGIGELANRLASQFAVAQGADGSNQYQLTVENIRSQNDYIALMAYLNTVDVIENIQMQQIRADVISFQFAFGGEVAKVQSLLELDGKLQHNGYPDELRFRWQSGLNRKFN